jgi:hypothetical protein
LHVRFTSNTGHASQSSRKIDSLVAIVIAMVDTVPFTRYHRVILRFDVGYEALFSLQ